MQAYLNSSSQERLLFFRHHTNNALSSALHRATIGESLKAVTQQLHEAEAQHKHLVELEADLQRREDMFERQVTPLHLMLRKALLSIHDLGVISFSVLTILLHEASASQLLAPANRRLSVQLSASMTCQQHSLIGQPDARQHLEAIRRKSAVSMLTVCDEAFTGSLNPTVSALTSAQDSRPPAHSCQPG